MPPIPTQMSLEDAVDDPEAGGEDGWQPASVAYSARPQDLLLAPEDDGMGGDHAMDNIGLIEPSELDSGGHGDFGLGEPSDFGDAGGAGFGDFGSFDDPVAEKAGDDSIEVARRSEGGLNPELRPASLGEDSIRGDGDLRMSDAFGSKRGAEDEVRLSDDQFGNDNSMGDFGGDFDMSNVQGVQFGADESGSGSGSQRRSTQRPKRRRMELDTDTTLSGLQIKQQLANTDDITREFVSAPCSRKEIEELQESSAHDFSKPLVSTNTLAPELLEMYARLIPKSLEPPGKENAFDDAGNDDNSIEDARRSEGGLDPELRLASLGEDSIRADGDLRMSEGFGKSGAGDDISLGGGDQFADQSMGDFGDDFDMGMELGAGGDARLSHVADDASFDGTGEGDGDGSPRSEAKRKAEWSKQTVKMFHILDKHFTTKEFTDGDDKLDFTQMLEQGPAKRKTAAVTFFQLLVLKTTGMIDVDQSEAFGSILLNKTGEFDSEAARYKSA